MPSYIVGEIHITDPAAYEAHVPRALATIARFGGRVVAGGDDPMPERIFIIEFPTAETVRRGYQSQDYQEALKVRPWPVWMPGKAEPVPRATYLRFGSATLGSETPKGVDTTDTPIRSCPTKAAPAPLTEDGIEISGRDPREGSPGHRASKQRALAMILVTKPTSTPMAAAYPTSHPINGQAALYLRKRPWACSCRRACLPLRTSLSPRLS
jgi:uncharacterized protein (DUF1330 family)